MSAIKRGDIVEPTKESGFWLRSGGSAYQDAVCVSASPLILVSRAGDMRWSATVKTKYFHAVGRATPAMMKTCDKRLKE